MLLAMWLGEALFVSLAVAFIVMLILGVFVRVNLKHMKKENKDVAIPVQEVNLHIVEPVVNETIDNKLDPRPELMSVPATSNIPETINLPEKALKPLAPSLEPIQTEPGPSIMRDLESQYYDLKAGYRETKTSFFDSVDNDKYTVNLEVDEQEKEEGIDSGISTCPHCHSSVPETMYCIYCGQSLLPTLSKEAL
ncbi:MAG: hypothetical protein ACXAEX_12395 [Promethearchaeota archaeon]